MEHGDDRDQVVRLAVHGEQCERREARHRLVVLVVDVVRAAGVVPEEAVASAAQRRIRRQSRANNWRKRVRVGTVPVRVADVRRPLGARRVGHWNGVINLVDGHQPGVSAFGRSTIVDLGGSDRDVAAPS